jgi:hypothetical protein
MAIRITRNEAGNCITFVGSSNPVYWNSCLSAQLNESNSALVDIINDIRSANEETIQYEFYAVDAADFADKDGNAFGSPQDMVDYVNLNANVTGVSDTGADLTDVSVNFRLDETSTSVIMDNGASFGVNTIKAVADIDGTIHIHAIGAGSPDGSEDAGDHKHFEKLIHTNVSVNGNAVAGGLQDVVNTLNELFTVGAFEAVVISDPYSTMIADVAGVDAAGSLAGDAVNPSNSDVAAGSAGHYNKAGWLSSDTIDQAGEYFTFDIRVEGIIGMGLVVDDIADVNGNTIAGDPAKFCDGVANNGSHGLQFGHFFHPSPDGPWTNYGAKTGYVQGVGWSNATHKFSRSPEGADWLAGNPVKMRTGIDEMGFISIDYYDASEGVWITCARTNYPTLSGVKYKLGIKLCDSNARLASLPKIHLLEPAAPTLYFRYVESPDGVYHYPVFATEEEANYYDLNHDGIVGTGTSRSEVFSDDPTQTNWYMPTTGDEEAGTSIPTGTFHGNTINWSEVTTLTNADLAPTAFSDATFTVDENAGINIPVTPTDADFTTTVFDADGSGLTLVGGNIQGTAPEVAGNNVTNPSDDYVINVVRTNTYGSATGSLTVTVTNLTAPSTAVSGFNWENTSTPLVDSDTLDDGSVVHMNTALTDGKRLIFDQTWIETNVLPNLTAVGDKFFVGIQNGHDWTDGVQAADFGAHFSIERLANNQMKSTISNGTTTNEVTVSSITDAYYDYAFEYDGTDLHVIACNVDSINTEPSINDGGTFSRYITQTGQSGNLTFHIGVEGGTADLSATTSIDIPTAPVVTNDTPWTKALNFSGSSEHLKQVSSSMYHQPLQMNGLANTVDLGTRVQGETSNNTSSRPWATAVVFKSDGYSGNQMIWNQGEGSVSGNDNIYLRLTAVGSLMFGWGREGTGYNECKIANQSISSSNWYAVYVAHSGVRLGGNDASAANLADCFDIRLMSSADSFGSLGANLSTASNWTSTGQRMDRTVAGDFTIGGRGSGYGFRGKVASMITTTLISEGNFTHSTPNSQQPGGLMYTDAQIEVMLTDPVKWVADYKVRHGAYNVSAPFRPPTSRFTIQPFLVGSSTSAPNATQVWLMGDGVSDSYANGVRNYINPADQNYVKLQLNSMVSNDIETVNIAGLT